MILSCIALFILFHDKDGSCMALSGLCVLLGICCLGTSQ